ncbi:MAG: hypothetical protein GY908_11000 [Flavobacteriales bacterium]|nr:hypothetical protein [Flavobacteriales bacterium]
MSFFSLKESVHHVYDIDFKKGINSKNLLIVFSTGPRFTLYKNKFSSDVLYIADKKLYHYVFNPVSQCKLLKQFIESNGYESVIFLGSSKGGTGALLWSGLIDLGSIRKNAVVFSPLTNLYPRNPVITFPAYNKMVDLSEVSEPLRVNLERFGNIAKYALPSALVFYSGGYKMDRVEAERLTQCNLFRLELSTHGAINPFAIDLSSDEKVVSLVEKLYINAQKDIDLNHALSCTKEQLYNEYSKIKVPEINKLLESIF